MCERTRVFRHCKGAVQGWRAWRVAGAPVLAAANYRSLINPVNWGSHEKSVIALRHASRILISSLRESAERFNAITWRDTRPFRSSFAAIFREEKKKNYQAHDGIKIIFSLEKAEPFDSSEFITNILANVCTMPPRIIFERNVIKIALKHDTPSKKLDRSTRTRSIKQSGYLQSGILTRVPDLPEVSLNHRIFRQLPRGTRTLTISRVGERRRTRYVIFNDHCFGSVSAANDRWLVSLVASLPQPITALSLTL